MLITIPILGLICNIFAVFIIIAYKPLKKLEGTKNKRKELEGEKGDPNKLLTLKRITIKILIANIIFGMQFKLAGNWINYSKSIKDGKLKITEGKIIICKKIQLLGKIIIKVQNKYNIIKEDGLHKEIYIILLTNKLGIKLIIYSQDWVLTIISWEKFNLS
jgi:NADH:ubiquinone oxidoreductase subunit 2 (subunit N)